MNCAQALAIAAAAFVAAGDPSTEPTETARAEFAALVAHGAAAGERALHAAIDEFTAMQRRPTCPSDAI